MKKKILLLIIVLILTSLKFYSQEKSGSYLFQTNDNKRKINFELSVIINNNIKYGFFNSEAIGNSVLDSITIEENNFEFISYLAGNYRIAGNFKREDNDYIGTLDINGTIRNIKGSKNSEDVDNSRFDNDFSWFKNSNEVLVNSFEKGIWSLSKIDLKKNRDILFESSERIQSPFLNSENSKIYFLQKNKNLSSFYSLDISSKIVAKLFEFEFTVVEIIETHSKGEFILLTPQGIKLFSLKNKTFKEITNSKSDFAIRLSPTENILSFTSSLNESYDIYTYNLDIDSLKQLTKNSGNNFNQRWSSDGKLLTHISWRDGNPEVYVMNSDGSNQRRITNNQARDNSPNFTPDNKNVYWISRRDENSEIYMSEIEKPLPINLTQNSYADESPLISSDGKYLAFLSDRNGNRKIFFLNLTM